MHTGAFAAAGQRLADTDDSFSSAPRGILIGQIAQILRAGPNTPFWRTPPQDIAITDTALTAEILVVVFCDFMELL